MLDDEWEDLQRLLSLVQKGRLTPQGEQRLRYLVWTSNPDAFKMDLGQVLRAGFFMVGLHLFQEHVRQEEAKAAA